MLYLRALHVRPQTFISRFSTSAVSWASRKSLRKFKLADIGEGITECEVIKWNVKPAATVQLFDPLCEVQSDKASVEITSPFDGVVKELLVKEGEIAKVGEGLCILEVDEEAAAASDTVDTEPLITPPSKTPASSSYTTSPAPETTAEPTPVPLPPASARRHHPLDPNAPKDALAKASMSAVLATPSVRHFARHNGIDLALLAPGSGKNGRIEKNDVEAYLTKSSASQPATPASAAQPTGATTLVPADEIVELGRTRYGMWKAMTKSLEIPQFGFSTTLDLTTLHDIMPILNAHIPTHFTPVSAASNRSAPIISSASFHAPPAPPSVPDSGTYTRLTYLPILLKTLSRAMLAWPLFRASINSSSSPSDKPTLTIRPHADISIGLSTPTGLYTPTIQRVDTASIYALASQLKHLSYLGRQVPSGLTPAHMPKRGGTVSVSNVGGIGDVDSAAPVLVPGGGVAIVAIGRAKWVWDVDRGDGKGERRLKVGVSWSADHRVVEGAELIAFVESWRTWVEAPQRLIADSV